MCDTEKISGGSKRRTISNNTPTKKQLYNKLRKEFTKKAKIPNFSEFQKLKKEVLINLTNESNSFDERVDILNQMVSDKKLSKKEPKNVMSFAKMLESKYKWKPEKKTQKYKLEELKTIDINLNNLAFAKMLKSKYNWELERKIETYTMTELKEIESGYKGESSIYIFLQTRYVDEQEFYAQSDVQYTDKENEIRNKIKELLKIENYKAKRQQFLEENPEIHFVEYKTPLCLDKDEYNKVIRQIKRKNLSEITEKYEISKVKIIDKYTKVIDKKKKIVRKIYVDKLDENGNSITSNDRSKFIKVENIPSTNQYYIENVVREKIIEVNSVYQEEFDYPIVVSSGSYKSYSGNAMNISQTNIRMRSASFYELRSLGDQRMIHVHKDQCVIDCLVHMFEDVPRFKNSFNYEQLCKQFDDIDSECLTKGISANNLIEFVKRNYSKRLSLYIIDDFNNKFVQFQHPKADHSLVLKMVNEHCYIIKDETEKERIIRLEYYDMGQFNFCPNVTENNYEKLNVKGMKMENIINHLTKQQTDESKEYLIISGTTNLMTICKALAEKTGFQIEEMNCDGAYITGFKNPFYEKNRYVLLNDNIEKCLEICKLLYSKTENIEHKFRNQSLASLTYEYFCYLHGNIPKSFYNNNTLEIMDTYKHKAIVETFNECVEEDDFWRGFRENWGEEEQKECMGKFALDICKSYTNVMYRNDVDFPIFDIFSTFEKYVPSNDFIGEYIIEKPIQLPFGPVLYDVKYSAVMIKGLIERGIIKHEDIDYKMKPSMIISNSIFRDFIENIYETFDMKTCKLMINSLSGMFGITKSKRIKVCMSNSHDTVSALYRKYTSEKKYTEIEEMDYKLRKDNVLDITNINDMYFISLKSQVRMDRDYLGIYNHIIDGAKLQVIDLAIKIHNLGGIVTYIKTDCVGYIRNEEIFIEKEKKKRLIPIHVDEKLIDVGSYRKDKYSHRVIKTKCNGDKMIDISKLNNYSFEKLVIGGGGCGKTYMACNMSSNNLEERDNTYLYLCPTGKSVDGIKQYGIDNVFTLDEKFLEVKDFSQIVETIKKSSVRYIIIDEASMVKAHFMSKLAIIKRHIPYMKIFFFGDFNQCPTIEDKEQNEYSIDYKNNKGYMSLFKEVEKLPYNPITGRYTQELYDLSIEFLETGKLSNKFNFIDNEYDVKYTSICKSNFTKRRIDKECMEKYISKQGKNDKIIVIPYIDNKETQKQDVVLCKGVKIVCRKNNTKFTSDVKEDKLKSCKKISNGSFLTVVDIHNMHVELSFDDYKYKNIFVEFCYFHDFYELAYCNTVYRYQGATIKDKYTIYDVESMNREELYTALTRAKKLEDIYICGNKERLLEKVFENYVYNNDIRVYENKRTMKGCVYIIENMENKIVYIGETKIEKRETSCEAIKCRFNEHIDDAVVRKKSDKFHTAMREIGVEKFKIRVLYEGMFYNKKELRDMETKYIKMYLDENELYNTKGVTRIKNEKEKPVFVIDNKYISTTSSASINLTKDRINVSYKIDGKACRKQFRFSQKGEEATLKSAEDFLNSLGITNYEVIRK